jgi:cystathionine beta-lyase
MRHEGVNRRSFLRNAGLTAIAGATVGSLPATAGAALPLTGAAPPSGKYDFDEVFNRIGTTSVKFDQQLRTYGKGSVEVGMGIADMDFRAAPSITKALQERLQHENWGYLDTGDYFQQIIAQVVAWNKKRHNLTIDPDTVVLGTGVHPGLIAALQTFSPKGSRVLLQTPTYNGFYSDLTFTDTIAEESPLKVVDGRYQMDFDDFERRIGPDTYAFILCNPQNPTGNCWSEADLMRIGEICLKRRVVVLADEIHCDYVTKGQKYTPFASLPDKKIVDNSLTFKAASKSFGLAAHKAAWWFTTNPDFLARVKKNHRADLSTMGLVANMGALTGGEDWLNQCVDYIDGNHEFAVKFVKANIPMLKAYKPEGTYLLWLDCSAVASRINAQGLADAENRTKKAGAKDLTQSQMLERFFVKEAKVHLNYGSSYGRGGETHMRMNLATSRKMIEKALTNIAQALDRAGAGTGRA